MWRLPLRYEKLDRDLFVTFLTCSLHFRNRLSPDPLNTDNVKHQTRSDALARGTSTAKPRIAMWDNARMIIIFLVVIGHMITTTRMNGTPVYGLYVFMYFFHMPAIILLSGVFMKIDVTRKSVRGVVQLLVTWGLWEILWIGIRTLQGREAFSDEFLVKSSWSLWFLFSLATMRLLLPMLARMKYPVTISIVIGLLSGLSPHIGTEFSVSRTLAFLPFFVVGWAGKDRGWFTRESFLHPSHAKKALAAGVGLVILALTMIPSLREYWRVDKWLLWNDGYQPLLEKAGVGDPGDAFTMLPGTHVETAVRGLLIAMFLVAIAWILVWVVLTLTPRKEYWFTVWGSRTLYVYLLHGPIVQVLRRTGVIEYIGDWGVIGTATIIAIGFVTAAILSTKFVSKIFKPIIEPNVDWLVRPEPSKPAA